MERVKAVFKPSDYPGQPDEATKAGLHELFAYLFPGQENPEIDLAHAGIAVTAQNPLLALNLAKMSGFIVRDLGWCQDQKLHELAVQTVHLHFNCQFTLRARAARAQSLGLGPEALAAIPDWQTNAGFSATEKLVIEYSYAVMTGAVPDALFSRLVARFGETAAIECTAAIGWWSMWAMIINALHP